MDAARMAGLSMEEFSKLSRHERLAWLVRVERSTHPPPVERDFWQKVADMIGRAVRG